MAEKRMRLAFRMVYHAPTHAYRFYLGGTDITEIVTGVNISVANTTLERPEVELTLDVLTVDVTEFAMPETQVLVSLGNGIEDVMIALGWKPPAEPNRRTYTVPHMPEFPDIASDYARRLAEFPDITDHQSPDAND